MIDLGIMFISYVMLPVSTMINIILLFPIPQTIQKRVISVCQYYISRIFFLSLIAFVLYVYAYSTTHFDTTVEDIELRMHMRSKIWKLERNYHITLFNLINWTVCAGTCNLLTSLENKQLKKDKKQ